MRVGRRNFGLLSALALSACQGREPAVDSALAGSERDASVAIVAEAWISPADTALDVDTPALWTDGRTGIVVVTGKASHDLRLYDGATGETLGSLGREGAGLGEFSRPNGVIVVDDFALVVERDNGRVQVLRMPDGESLGWFGQDVLEYPYGLAATGTPSDLTVWVTDDYEYEEDVVPQDLTHRLHRFRVSLPAGASPEVSQHDAFGAADGAGALRVVESIQVDSAGGDVFVADESRRSYLRYDDQGAWVAGPALGAGYVTGDPEGIVLVECRGGGGYWVATDQQEEVSLFRVFSRLDLAYLGAFRGVTTANTDGTTFAVGPVPGFPRGVLYAIHDDQALSAFSWPAVVDALGLRADCGVR